MGSLSLIKETKPLTHNLHWSERPEDFNTRPSKFFTRHINRPRISSLTILKMLTLKSQLLGTKLDVLKEAETFEERNSSIF